MKNKATIVVFGREYNMVSGDSVEHMHRVGCYLDEQAKQLIADGMSVSSVGLATLTALNVTDEYLKLRDAVDAVRTQSEQLGSNLKSSSLENAMLRKENGKLTEQLEAATQEVAQLKKKLAQFENDAQVKRQNQNFTGNKVQNKNYNAGQNA